MSTREPMWFCHECNAEMQPLMMPDPHCASCHGTFVEKIENPEDDPRHYHHHAGGAGGDDDDDQPFNALDFLTGLQAIMSDGRPTSPRNARDQPRSPNITTSSSGFSIRIDRTGDGPTRTIISSSRPPPTRSDSLPPMFGGHRHAGGDITGPLMFQYLAALLSQPGGNGAANPMLAELFGGGAEPGRMGDYVFSQEALDQILTQLMESASSHPVPATEEIMQNLPKTVLEEGSPLLEKDCAVCKEQFQLGTEDPTEQIVVTLPCKHPFHEGCIMPWLKSSATCPVCRHELVPQPHHHGPGEGPSRRPNSPGSNNNIPRSPFGSGGGNNASAGGPGGLFGSFFNTFMAGEGQGNGSSNIGGSNTNTAGRQRGNSTGGGNGRRPSQDNDHVPGSWEDVD